MGQRKSIEPPYPPRDDEEDVPPAKLVELQTVEEMHRLMKQAMAGRQPISVVYEGGERSLCPHILGLKDGRLRALCYQYGGKSRSGLGPPGDPANWRCISFEKLRAVRLLNGSWRSAERHSRTQTCIDEVEADSEIPDHVPSTETVAGVRRALEALSLP